jgi:hypothetical protein
MTNINQLSSIDTLSGGDLVPVWATNNGDTRKSSLTLLASYINDQIELPVDISRSQYSAPSATGFTVAITSPNTWLVLNPTNAFAAGTISLPVGVPDLSMVSIVTTQAITALTVSTSGAAVVGAPVTAVANTAFTMRYDAVTNSWYPENQAFVSLSAFGQLLVLSANAAAARATLGLGTIATQNAATVAITGGSITGITDLAVADGGTGASTDTQARINLGVQIGVNVQAWDADLDALAGLAANGVIARTGAGTAAARTITAGTGISVANGDGVSGNPTITSTDVLQNLIATDIAAIANAINTTGKAAGKMVWDTTNSKIKVATGALDASTWVDADGTNAVTPS